MAKRKKKVTVKKTLKKKASKPKHKPVKRPSRKVSPEKKVHAPNIEVNPDLCKACYICIDICPKTVFGKSTRLSKSGVYSARPERPAQCILCRECEIHCPDLAISVEKGE